MKTKNNLSLMFIILILIIIPFHLPAQKETKYDRYALIQAARDMMIAVRYCALITVDAGGQPHARAMDAFEPDENMNVWMATNPKSRKVVEIKNNPKVSIYYALPKGQGYVTLNGIATIVNDPDEKSRRWKEEWKAYYKDRDRDYRLVQIRPTSLEIVDYANGISSTSATWGAPTVTFPIE